ncbi:hypothetical protein Nmel_014788 [Mimus melanotis]
MFDLVSPVLLLRHLQEEAQKAHLPVGLICPAGVHLLQQETLRNQQIPLDLDHLIWNCLAEKG